MKPQNIRISDMSDGKVLAVDSELLRRLEQ